MQKISVDQLIQITRGSLLKQGKTRHAIRAVSTDTRHIEPESLFIALTGAKFDGHDYIEQAIEKGAGAVCASDETKVPKGDFTVILVKDTLLAYQAIAAEMRKRQGYTVVGVTGSVGKTSTRAMIASALSLGRTVYQTKANYNNEIGLPKTLLETPDDADVCIVEMAMRGLGQIRQLTKIAKPDIAVITNIGFSHIEILGSQENILKAKTEILEGLPEDGLFLFNANDPNLCAFGNGIADEIRTAAVMVGEDIPVAAEFTVRGYDLVQTADHVAFKVEIKSFQGFPVILENVVIPVPGAHNVTNALIGIAVAVELDLNLQDVISGLAGYQAIGNRQRVLVDQNITIIDDTYNAGPESMCAAIAMLSDIAGGRRKIAVLGGMLELGDYAPAEHEKVGRACFEQHIDKVFVCGPDAKSVRIGMEKALLEDGQKPGEKPQAMDDLPRIRLFETRDELAAALLNEVLDQDVILVKGSRSFEMEKVTKALQEWSLAETGSHPPIK